MKAIKGAMKAAIAALLLVGAVSADVPPPLTAPLTMQVNPAGFFQAYVQDNYTYPVLQDLHDAIEAQGSPDFAGVNVGAGEYPNLTGLGMNARTIYIAPCVIRGPFITPGAMFYVIKGENFTFAQAAGNTTYTQTIGTGDLAVLYPQIAGYAINDNCEGFESFAVYSGDGGLPLYPVSMIEAAGSNIQGDSVDGLSGAISDYIASVGNGQTYRLPACLERCGLDSSSGQR